MTITMIELLSTHPAERSEDCSTRENAATDFRRRGRRRRGRMSAAATRRTHRATRPSATRLAPDPVDLALQYSQALAEEELLVAVHARRQALRLPADLVAAAPGGRQALPDRSGAERLRPRPDRLRAELEWHDRLLEELPKLLAAERRERPRKEQ
jgi:hypothetical protein